MGETFNLKSGLLITSFTEIQNGQVIKNFVYLFGPVSVFYCLESSTKISVLCQT